MKKQMLIPIVLIVTALSCGCEEKPSSQSQPPTSLAAPGEVKQAAAPAEGFPKSRDYLLEWARLNAGGSKAGDHDGWTAFMRMTMSMEGVTRYVQETSPAFTALRGDGNQNDGTLYDAVNAAVGYRSDEPPGLAKAGRQFLDEFAGTSLAEYLDGFGDYESFHPPIPLSRPAFEMKLPEIGPARVLARVGCAMMTDRIRREDFGGFEKSLRSNLTLATAVSSRSTIFCHSIGLSIEALIVGRVIDEHLRSAFPSAVSRIALNTLRTVPRPNWQQSIAGERLMGLDTIDWVYDHGTLKDLFDRDDGLDVIDKEPSREFWIKREHAMAFYDDAVVSAGHVFDDDAKKAAASRVALSQAMEKGKDRDFSRSHMVAFAALPALERISRLEAEVRTMRSAAVVLMAIEIYRSDHAGTLPESLDALVPRYLDEVPIDWATRDRTRLQYRVIGPKADFLLYSVGRDQEDNGGVVDQALIRFGEARGTDAVFSVPDPEYPLK